MDANFTAPTDGDASPLFSGGSGIAVIVGIVLIELALLQVFSVASATGIYYLVPLLEVGEPKGFADWRSIFQVVSPSLTLPGGGVIVLSLYLMARRAASEVAAAKSEAATAQAEVADANERADAAQAEVAALRAELERRPRRRRRSIRS